ncbi:hypothetical protein [Myxococcus sp. AM010]|uniref:hypothetical protein n=1 Tax=Myxococcus sp. AM010 TaxID=2745138 RepID=UPI0015960C56|nr:hypothetical protein [Myxococcus sp. AM010]NVJ14903.1 hypothetical protein [Myxococcus sp. AM010]
MRQSLTRRIRAGEDLLHGVARLWILTAPTELPHGCPRLADLTPRNQPPPRTSPVGVEQTEEA